MKRVAIKIGSNVITRKDGGINIVRLASLVEQIAALRNHGYEVILISSGAVASGRSVIKVKGRIDSVSARQLFSSVGQVKLINKYNDLFSEFNIICGQVLATKENFSSRTHYLNQRNCMCIMLQNGVIPIVNENDAISVTELMFTDNDELSGLIATMMDVETLLILSNIDGIYDGDPSLEESKLIKQIFPNSKSLNDVISPTKSSFGRGGMLTKCNIARKVAKEGIEVVIANGGKDNILIDVLVNKSSDCSRFIPSNKKTSGIKKWLAHSDGFAKGRIIVNDGVYNLLKSENVGSILLVGVTDTQGDFVKGDLIDIYYKDQLIGIGVASYDSNEVKQLLGKHESKPIIHYNYLYIYE